jgi:hypothetical protein
MSGQDRTCLVCGATGRDVGRRLAQFDPPLPSGPYQAIDRCLDSQACRDRLEAAGDPWPLEDRGQTHASLPPAAPGQPPAPAERPAWEAAS